LIIDLFPVAKYELSKSLLSASHPDASTRSSSNKPSSNLLSTTSLDPESIVSSDGEGATAISKSVRSLLSLTFHILTIISGKKEDEETEVIDISTHTRHVDQCNNLNI